jgi:hypothetical protein
LRCVIILDLVQIVTNSFRLILNRDGGCVSAFADASLEDTAGRKQALMTWKNGEMRQKVLFIDATATDAGARQSA